MPTTESKKTEAKQDTVKRKEQKQLQKQEKKLGKQQDKQSNNGDKDQRKKRREEKKMNKQPIRRILPIWLKVILVLVLSFAGLIIGLVVGYSVLGDGNPTEVLNFDTWQHILDIVIGEG